MMCWCTAAAAASRGGSVLGHVLTGLPSTSRNNRMAAAARRTGDSWSFRWWDHGLESRHNYNMTQRNVACSCSQRRSACGQDGRLSLLLDFVWAQSVRMAGSNYYEILYGRSHRAGTELLSKKIKRVS